ncbi:MAG: sugar phosphate isomerase/epimerase [Bacteroidetes bacterium]|nr:sugar phosphate isomerase/epimerase [Bacteroidota bacterium]
MTTRRDFLKQTSQTAAFIPFMNMPFVGSSTDHLNAPLTVSIFSKHLQFLDCAAAAEAAAEMGFNGLDLTVRPGGHVEPASVKEDLPIAMKRIRSAGGECSMITTSIESIRNPVDVDIIRTAAACGVQYYRTNWYKYPAGRSLPETLKHCAEQIKGLSELSNELRITGCYQNHAGTDVGSSFWEVHQILTDAVPGYFGAQFDIRHAMVEGGFSWENGLALLRPRIKMIVLKDFRWEKVNGKWITLNTPIGEGMVDFTRYFRMLKDAGMKPPVSLHCEYSMGGAEKGERSITVDKKIVFDAMKNDLSSVQRLWKES